MAEIPADDKPNPSIADSARILGASEVGAGALVAWDVIVGHPAKASLLENRSFTHSAGARVGADCILRSGTVIYERATLGRNVQTGHSVIIREDAQIGDDCVFGNHSVVREGAQLGRNVRLMESVTISEGAVIGDDVFIGPHVTFTAGRFMTGALQASGELTTAQATDMEGRYWQGPSVVVQDRVRIGSNAVILAGVRLGAGCIVAAGAVVSTAVPPGATVAGNPGRILKQGKA